MCIRDRYSKNDLKEMVKSCTGQLSKKDIFSYISCETTGLRSDEFYMVYRAILNTSPRKNKKKQKLQDQIELVFQVGISRQKKCGKQLIIEL